jgi:hypothetical protein
VTPAELAQRGMPQFRDGFDMVIEETTFQMYHKNRADQIGLVGRNLKPGGILLMVEKMDQDSPEVFAAREQQKDEDFKPLYFDTAQILQKRVSIVSKMNNMLATMDELRDAAKQHFSAAVVTFNAGNFYNIAASDDPANLASFIGNMIAPAVPPEYVYGDVPDVLFSPPESRYDFAPPRTTVRGAPWQQIRDKHISNILDNIWAETNDADRAAGHESERDTDRVIARRVAHRMIVKRALMERDTAKV